MGKELKSSGYNGGMVAVVLKHVDANIDALGVVEEVAQSLSSPKHPAQEGLVVEDDMFCELGTECELVLIKQVIADPIVLVVCQGLAETKPVIAAAIVVLLVCLPK